jgi:ParB family chromosome partitioning protein
MQVKVPVNESLKRLKDSGVLDGIGTLPDERTDPLGAMYDSMFERGPSRLGGHGAREIPLDLIDPWSDPEHERQPFKPYSKEKLEELAENIRQNGVITPVRLRPSPTTPGRYQLLAGHNRVAAAKLAGLQTVPSVVLTASDDQAKVIMVDSNLLQRQHLLPSEKAFAYKMRLDAMKHQGKRTDLTSGNVCLKLESRDSVAANEQVSSRTIQNFIRLTYLLFPLLDMVDAEDIPFTAGVCISFLPEQAQQLLLRIMREYGIKRATRSQGEELKSFKDGLSEETVLRIFGKSKKSLPKPQSIKITVDYPAKIIKRLRHDEELQRRVQAVVDAYVKEIGGNG